MHANHVRENKILELAGILMKVCREKTEDPSISAAALSVAKETIIAAIEMEPSASVPEASCESLSVR